MLLQEGMDNASLYPDASAVNDPDFVISLQYSLVKVLFNQAGYILGLKTVQIDTVLNRKFNWLGHSRSSLKA
jgi:hypothetical protein